MPEHIYQGSCPDATTSPGSRDPACPACQAMDEASAIADRLKRYNAWRRDDLGRLPLPDPTDIGDAIDTAVRLLRAGAPATTQPATPMWIPVEDRLPARGVQVLVYVPNARHSKIGMDEWDVHREAPVGWSSHTIETGEGWQEHEFEEVTHWAPLPPPPTQQGAGHG